jgi:hypothetical protein
MRATIGFRLRQDTESKSGIFNESKSFVSLERFSRMFDVATISAETSINVRRSDTMRGALWQKESA